MNYTAEQFKDDVIINIQNDASYSDEVVEALKKSKFEFEDSSAFTRREWNTYVRKLKIYCSAHGKAILESQKKKLYQFMDSLHGVRDDFMLMELIIFASAEMENHVITSNRIMSCLSTWCYFLMWRMPELHSTELPLMTSWRFTVRTSALQINL